MFLSPFCNVLRACAQVVCPFCTSTVSQLLSTEERKTKLASICLGFLRFASRRARVGLSSMQLVIDLPFSLLSRCNHSLQRDDLG